MSALLLLLAAWAAAATPEPKPCGEGRYCYYDENGSLLRWVEAKQQDQRSEYIVTSGSDVAVAQRQGVYAEWARAARGRYPDLFVVHPVVSTETVCTAVYSGPIVLPRLDEMFSGSRWELPPKQPEDCKVETLRRHAWMRFEPRRAVAPDWMYGSIQETMSAYSTAEGYQALLAQGLVPAEIPASGRMNLRTLKIPLYQLLPELMSAWARWRRDCIATAGRRRFAVCYAATGYKDASFPVFGDAAEFLPYLEARFPRDRIEIATMTLSSFQDEVEVDRLDIEVSRRRPLDMTGFSSWEHAFMYRFPNAELRLRALLLREAWRSLAAASENADSRLGRCGFRRCAGREYEFYAADTADGIELGELVATVRDLADAADDVGQKLSIARELERR